MTVTMVVSLGSRRSEYLAGDDQAAQGDEHKAAVENVTQHVAQTALTLRTLQFRPIDTSSTTPVKLTFTYICSMRFVEKSCAHTADCGQSVGKRCTQSQAAAPATEHS